MKKIIALMLLPVLVFFNGCENKSHQQEKVNLSRADSMKTELKMPTGLTRPYLYDKVLGLLVGSAIGDAMGAPTEMWSRNQMEVEYGYIDDLDTMVRNPSPEGTWDYNLPSGGTTDDTRWKALLADHLLRTGGHFSGRAWAGFITESYRNQISELKQNEDSDPEPYEISMRKVAWLQEWARVAEPYYQQKTSTYIHRLHMFYGGEMTCAGMLYTPLAGLFFPGDPESAYKAAFEISLFDLGYARDLSSLTAAMISMAVMPDENLHSILNVFRDIDPYHFFKSRLVGRSAYRIFRDAKYIMHDVNQVSLNSNPDWPDSWHKLLSRYDTLQLLKMQQAYSLLDQKNEVLPFHPAEIMLINLVGLMYGNSDFRTSLEFVVNYGRDNDTVAAITGAILGAFLGASALPVDLKEQVLDTNLKLLNIDLNELAENLTDAIMLKYQ